ncbi:MAG: glycosyltransferase family 1 protein, partial [Cyclobacteriaceae bacterium]
MGFSSFIFFNDSVMFQGFHLPELIHPKLSIYYIRDNLITQPYWRRHGTRLEPQLAKKYDMVVSNSDYLGDYLREFNPDTFMVGQGCDLSLFNPSNSPRPPELRNIPGPLIGYTGFLTSMRLDIPLLENCAAGNPEFSFVFVGPEDEEFKKSSLHKLSNV